MIERLKERLARALRPRSSVTSAAGTLDSSPTDDGLTTLREASREPNPSDIGRLRRERRRLLRAREQSVRDLGGLTLEMVRRDAFKPDLLKRRARDILGLEDGVHDIEDALSDARGAIPDPAIGSTSRCTCGAANDRSALFCAACGRSLRQSSAVGACDHCGTSLPGGAHFCPACGTATETAHESATGAGW